MNLKTSKIDSLLFWIAWAFGGGFIFSLVLPSRWYVVGVLVLLMRVFMWSIQKTVEVYSKSKIQEQ